MLDLIRGLHAPAWAVGFARGCAEAAVFAVIIFAGDFIVSADAPAALQRWAPLAFIGLRSLEGLADHIDPKKRRAPG